MKREMMKKGTALLLAAFLGVSLLSGCGGSNAQTTAGATTAAGTTAAAAEGSSPAQETKAVIDAYGEQVEIPSTVTSIVETGYAPISSLIYVVTGRTDVVSAMSKTAAEGYRISMWSTLEPDLSIPEAALLNDSAINFEELANYAPQVILCNKTVREANGEQLEAVGVIPVTIKFGEFEDVQEVIRIVGEIFDCEDRAASLIEFQKGILSYFNEKQSQLPEQRLKALYLNASSDDGTYRVFTGKHLASKMLNAAGYTNVAEDLTESTIVSVDMEQILEWNPDVIFLSNFDDFIPAEFTDGSCGQEWLAVSAVQNQKVYKTPVGMYRWDTFCVETPLMVKWLGQVANPAVFTEYDIKEDIKNFYQTYMDHTLSEEELNKILNTDANIYLDLK